MPDTTTSPRPSLQQDIAAAKALFARPPTLSGVVLAAIQEQFFSRWDPLRNATHLYVGEPRWLTADGKKVSAGYQYTALSDLVLKQFTQGVAPVFSEDHVLEVRFVGLPGDRQMIEPPVPPTLLGQWGDILLELYQQALVDYWNEENAQGSSRFGRLSALLVRMLTADREQYRAFLTVDLQKPDQKLAVHGLRAVSKDPWGGYYPEALPVLLVRRWEHEVEQAPLLLSLAQGLFRARTPEVGHLLPLFMSRRAEGRDIEYHEHRLWQSGDPDELLEQAFASLGRTLLENQLQEVSLIGRDLDRTVEDYQRRLSAITRPDNWFFNPEPTQPHSVRELSEELTALRDAMPHWLLAADPRDIERYRDLLDHLASVQRASQGKAFLDGIGDLMSFTRRTLLEKIHEEHAEPLGISSSDDIRLELDRVIAVATAGGGGGALGSIEKVRMTLTEFALENLGGFHHSKMRIAVRHCDRESAVPAWLTPDYVRHLVTAVDIGKTYLEALRAKLIDDADEARRREKLFTEQLRVQLPMAALELKIRAQSGFSEAGFRYIEALMKPAAAQRQVDGQEIVLRPLGFRAEADAAVDEVASMFIIGPKDIRHGPHVLYRPLFAKAGSHESALLGFQAAYGAALCAPDNDARPTPALEPLRQYETFGAVFEAIRQEGPLQDSVLTWMSPRARRLYDHGGFQEPHLPRSFEDDFAAFSTPGPARLSDAVVDGDCLHHLFTSTARTLIELADRQSVSNAEQRWAQLKEGAWQLFNVLLMFIRGPAAVAGWIYAVVASVDRDIRQLQARGGQGQANAWADVLVNLSFILSHHLAEGRAPSAAREGIPFSTEPAGAGRPRPGPYVAQGADLPVPMHLDEPALAPSGQRRIRIDDLLLRRFERPWPDAESLGAVIAEGELKGLIRLNDSGHLATYIGGRLYRVREEPGGGVRMITPDGSREGFYLKSTEAGEWSLDVKLRLRGGSGRGGRKSIKQIQDEKKAAAKVLVDRHKEIETAGKLATIAASAARAALKLKEEGTDVEAISRARQRYLQEAEKAFDMMGQSIVLREEQSRVAKVPKWKDAVCAFLGIQLGGCRETLEVLRRVREEERPSAIELELAQTSSMQMGSGFFERFLAYQRSKVAANERMFEWHRRERQVDRHLDDFAGLGSKTRDQTIGRTPNAPLERDTQASQLHSLRWLTLHELRQDEQVPPSLIDKTQEIAMANQSWLNLEQDPDIPARRRQRVLNTCIENYVSGLQTLEFWRHQQPEGTALPYTDRLLELIAQLRDEALEALSESLEARASEIAAQEELEKIPGLIQTRGSRGGTYLGKVRPPAAGQSRETVELADGDEVRVFQESASGSYWEEVKAPEPAPAPVATRPQVGLKRLVKEAGTQMQKARGELANARKELARALDHAARLKQPVRDPVYLQDVLEGEARILVRLAEQLESGLVSAEQSPERLNAQSQAANLRALALELGNEGLLIRVEATKASMPDMARVDFLHRQGAIEIRKNGPRSLLKSGDYLQEYLILDKAVAGKKSALLWVAHFHYPDLTPNDDLFTPGAAHLKTREERFLGPKAQARAEGARFERIRRGQPGRAQAAVDIWRSAISLPMARQFFFDAAEVDAALVEQLRRL
ncbi:dermonecrotic toxin domain-containing protein [Pseudomonas gingeri]